MRDLNLVKVRVEHACIQDFVTLQNGNTSAYESRKQVNESDPAVFLKATFLKSVGY